MAPNLKYKKRYLMKIMVKFFLSSVLLPLYLYASSFDVREIQNEFYTNVILAPVYKKSSRYASIEKSLKQRDTKFSLDENYWNKAKERLLDNSDHFLNSQFVTLVDLSKQILIVVLWDKNEQTFFPIGFDFISTGNMEKEKMVTKGEDHYFKTPSGLFSIHSGWRSKGEVYDDNVTMPYGNKDTFVFYFGKQSSIRYNTFDKDNKKIYDKNAWSIITDRLEFAMHAHISGVGLGHPQSHGCIRMTNELNAFLDNNLVFFKDFYNEKKEWIHSATTPPKKPKSYQLAGRYMLVVDEL